MSETEAISAFFIGGTIGFWLSFFALAQLIGMQERRAVKNGYMQVNGVTYRMTAMPKSDAAKEASE